MKWVAQFGEVKKYLLENYRLVTSIRVWYTNGFEVKNGITDERWPAGPLDAGPRQVIKDDMRILFERKDTVRRCYLSTHDLQKSMSKVGFHLLPLLFYAF